MPGYRVFGQLKWASMSGNALLTLTNQSSTKLLTVRGFEVRPVARKMTLQQMNVLRIMRVTGLAASTSPGQTLTAVQADTASLTLTGIRFMQDSAFTAGDIASSVIVPKIHNDALALSGLVSQRNFGPFRGLLRNKSRPSALERFTVRDGQQAAVVCSFVDRGVPLRVNVVVRYNGRTLYTEHIANTTREGVAIWAVDNNNGLGNSLEIVEVSVNEIGDSTTPFFQLVPVSPKDQRLTDEANQPNIVAYDTASPSTTGVLRFATDVACSPGSGIPEQYISDASAGTPKGLNYLHTKDFLGPAYAVYFPEHDAYGVDVRGDTFGLTHAHRRGRIIDNQAPIVLRAGESIGLVTSAELATGTSAMPTSGFAPFEFACDVYVSDLVTPTIRFTGLQTGSKVALVEQNTETLVSLLTESAGTAEYTFTSNPGTFVDARILCAGYVFQQIDDIELLASVQTFPIDQTVDLVYDALLSEAVTFSGATKRIICDAGNTSISVPAVYTEWVDWALTGNNLQYYHAFENQGGADIDPGAGTSIPKYCYLVNSWRVRPQEASHTLAVVDGILLVSGGGDSFVDTLGAYTVRINYQQPVQAIAVATGGGGGSGDWTTTEKEHIRHRLGIDGSAAAPSSTPSLATAASLATVAGYVDTEIGAIQTDLTTVLSRVDVATSTRLAAASYTAPDNASIATILTRTDVATSTRMAAFTLPTNFSSLAITAAGKITVGTNDDKTGYTIDQTFPANFASMAISGTGLVSTDTKYMNGVQILGGGTLADPWRT